MARIIGCRDLHIAPLKEDKPGTAKPKYDVVTRIPSLISISISDTVEENKFYSDDIVEQTFSKTSGKEVTIELGYITNELEALITGKEVDSEGVLIQKSSDSPKEVALMFRAPKSKGNAFRYLCLYKGTLSRTDSEYTTQEDSVESTNITLTGTFIPLASSGSMSATADSDDTNMDTIVKDWFTKVYGADYTTP